MADQPNRRAPTFLQVLGPLRVGSGEGEVDAGPRQQRTLLALLLARVGQPTGVSSLIELLWEGDSPVSAVNMIHKYVGALRRLLEPDLPSRATGTYLVRHGNGYLFTAGPETLDLVRFRRLVAEARACTGSDELDEALDRYVEALRLVHGPAGDDLADTPAARATFANLDGEFFDTVVPAAELAVRLRQPSGLLAPLRQAAAMDPLNELIHACLVTTLAAAGHRADALKAYESICARLADELGIDPGQELREAHRRVLTSTVRPAGTPAPSRLVVRAAQLPPDLQSFTGRADELATLDRLAAGLRDGRRTSPLVVAMDGLGGTGKSTLAIRFAHLVADGFPDGQLYLDLHGNRADVESVPAGIALRSLLHGLGVHTPDMPDTFDARLGTYRSLTAGKRILVLLDSVHGAEQVRPLLPSSAGSLALLTSRRPLLDLAARDGAHLLHVDVPDLPAARDLLERRLAGRQHEMASRRLVDEVVELCGRVPLTLATLAARVSAYPGLSLATIASDLQHHPPREALSSGALP